MTTNFISRIYKDYHNGKEYTSGVKYLYSIQYNPIAAIHTWIIRKPKIGGEWSFLRPVPTNMDFVPRNSTRR